MPASFLVWWAAACVIGFGAETAFIGLDIWLQDKTADVRVCAPFLLGVAVALGLILHGRRPGRLRSALWGVRIGCVVVAAAAVLASGGVIVSAFSDGDAFSMVLGVIIGAVFFACGFLPYLLPLILLGRRLKARVAAGNPAWNPHLSSPAARARAAIAFCTATGGVAGVGIGMITGVLNPSIASTGTMLTASLVGGVLGLFGGAVIGWAIGLMHEGMFRDKNLARALPPVAFVVPPLSVTAALFGPGWGAAALGVTMWVVILHGRTRHRVFAWHECQRCGYDLRGGTGVVCPECGAPVESAGVVA